MRNGLTKMFCQVLCRRKLNHFIRTTSLAHNKTANSTFIIPTCHGQLNVTPQECTAPQT
jgi:hypothetical protein